MSKNKFEEMFDRLPSNIKETEVLRLDSKKVLAALLELLLHSEARKTRIIYASNSRLKKLSGVGSDNLQQSIGQLIDYDLITRKVGESRKKGEISKASEYTINFKKIKEPIVEKNFDDLFDDFFDDDKTLENPIRTATTITTTTSITTSTTTSNTISTSMSNTISKPMSISNEDIENKKDLNEKEMNDIKLNIYEELKKEVETNLVGTDKKELTNNYYNILDKMRRQQAILGKNYTRIRLYIDRIFNEKLELIQTLVATT